VDKQTSIKRYEKDVQKFGGNPHQRKQEHEMELQQIQQQFVTQAAKFEKQSNNALYVISEVPELQRLVNDIRLS